MSISTDRADRQPTPWLAAALAILPVVAASLIGSAVTVPQIPGWYAGLAKPPFNPPNWLFAPVWTMLFALMALAAFRTWRLSIGTAGRAQALLAYHVQLALNMLWSCAFFGLNSPAGGLVVIALLLAAIVWTMRRFAGLGDKLSVVLFAPYLAWVSFASLLNALIWWLNR
ncbi:MAG TPA: TspO/MBR family protein [Bosea sp. (in: a-proteobacteria)]|jgi:tryptophan-rich sensory protein|nr:TspO/MBR family protein [Bosea sp. (in: a-proteobacteria)]